MHLPSASAASYSCANRMSPSMMARRGGVAMLIPDVPWYESQQAGWAGSLPDQEEGMGHGVLEQIFIDGTANGLSWFGLFLSIRATLPVLNGLVLPKAPEAVTDQLVPFLRITCDRYLSIFQRIFPYNINGVDLAVFPAFVSVLFLMSGTEALGMELPSSRGAEQRKGRRRAARLHPMHATAAKRRLAHGMAALGVKDKGIVETIGGFLEGLRRTGRK